MPGCLNRNQAVVLVLTVVEVTLFWNHIGVILVDCSIPPNSPIYNESLPYVEGEITHAQATAPTSGKELILEVAHLGDGFVQMEEHHSESLGFSSHLCSQLPMGS